MKLKVYALVPWALGFIVSLLAIIAWSQQLGGRPLTAYVLFPVLGLLAFGLMWSHYIADALSYKLPINKVSERRYFQLSTVLVLALILLHPGLYELQLFLDGLGLPPNSYLSMYTETSARIALLIANISLVAFLSFELRRKFDKKKWWKYIEYANVAAMFGIFFHALTIGGNLMSGWYRYVWYVYGVLLVIAISYQYYRKFSKKTAN